MSKVEAFAAGGVLLAELRRAEKLRLQLGYRHADPTHDWLIRTLEILEALAHD